MGKIKDARTVLPYLRLFTIIVYAASMIYLIIGIWNDSIMKILYGLVIGVISSVLFVIYYHYKEIAGIDEKYLHG